MTDYKKGHIHNHSKTLVQENDTKKEMGTQETQTRKDPHSRVTDSCSYKRGACMN